MLKVYLDYGATTPVDKEVLAAMRPYFSVKFGNAMSLHSFGREAGEAVEKARKKTADFFDADPKEIIFTSGATESNNLVIKGIIKAYYANPDNKDRKPHIITTAFEHHCVMDACKSVENEGLAEISYIRPDSNGLISVFEIKKAIQPNTILVSIMYVNNEIGTVQPIVEIGKMIKNINSKILFHTDATQAVNYFDCNVNKLNVDLLSMSAHKIYGPKGIGALYIKNGTPIKSILDGGGQENGKRAGTHNVPGIVGLGKAIELVEKNRKKDSRIITQLRDRLIKRVLKEISGAKLNGSKIKRLPNNANFSFTHVEGESLILLLDQEGIAASTGSACSSGTLEPSHVLLSLGMTHEQAHGSLRLTLGKHNTRNEIDYTVDKLKEVVKKLREVSGNVIEEYYKSNKS